MRPWCFPALLAAALPLAAAEPVSFRQVPPELKGVTAWVNGKPTSLKALRGKVVVLHFWTFGCVNCQRNVPHYKKWHEDFAGRDVVLLGVHTPELENEKKLESIKGYAADNGIKYLVAVDGDKKVWNAWTNRWWPSTYLIDREGNGRYRWDGELEWQGAGGEAAMRKKIEELLAEPVAAKGKAGKKAAKR